MARLAITRDVLSEYARLDNRVKSAVEAAVAKFTHDPQGGLHLEKVAGSRDDRIRVIPVDGSSWYAVVLSPDGGNTYCLLRILPRDKAIAYTACHQFGVNPATGTLQVSNGTTTAPLTARRADATPEETTASEAWPEATELRPDDPPPEPVRPGDLVAAMERTPNQVAFVSGPEELQDILAHPFAAWRTFLHPSQHTIAYRPSYVGPAQVTGGPGTGKTVTVLHRAAFLAERAATSAPVHEPGIGASPATSGAPPVLLTTFNGNLAEALHAQLDLLVQDAEIRHRIEVLNVDRLAYRIVKQARGTPAIADERVLRTWWAKATAASGLDLTPDFLKNEWEQVILAQDLRDEQAYLTCPRTGRGRPLTKAQRSRLWQAAKQVTADLAAIRQTTHLQLANEATHLLRQAGGGAYYRHILVDEAQDLHPAQWRLLRTAVAPGPDDLFIAGDPHQRIYNNRVSLASLRISVRGRSRKLSLNYRTTQEILAWAMPLLGSHPVTGLDGETDSLLGYRSPMHGPHPQLRIAASRAEEFSLLTERIRSWLAAGLEPHAIGVTARTAALVREAREALEADGTETTSMVGRGTAAGVRAGTMHAMKGLEFQAVAVIGVEAGVVPNPAAVTPEDEDALAHAQDLERERCVLFVACTRARDHLYVSGAGEPSAFLFRAQDGPAHTSECSRDSERGRVKGSIPDGVPAQAEGHG